MKKSIFKILSVVLLLTSLTACAKNANQQTKPEQTKEQITNETTQTTTKPTTEKALNVSIASGGRTLDPSAATDASSAIFVNAAYDQLVTFGTIEKDGYVIANPDDIKPMLAKSWEISPDLLSYTFKLDENAKFANGDKVDADAVIYSLDRVKNSNTSSFLFALSNIETMTKIDDNTVVFKLSKPSTILFKLLQMHILSIVNPKELATVENIDEYLKTKTAGSGAFNIEKWDAATDALLTRRDEYWRGMAGISKVKITFIPESSNRVLLIDKGDMDLTIDIPAKDLEILEKNQSLDIRTYDSNGISYFIMNNSKAPFDNLKVRQAINFAIPYDSMVNDIMSGKAKRLNHVIPSAMPAYIDEPSIYNYDLEKAKELLKEAGLENGFTFKLTVSNGKQDWIDSAILIQSELAKINITVNIEKMERPQYLEAVKGNRIEAAIGTYTAFVNDPGYFFGNTLNSKGEYNYALYKNEKVDALWDKAESESDANKRFDYYKEAQKLVEQDAPWANLYEYTSTVVLGDKIEEFLYFPDGALRFYDIKVK